MHAFLINSHQLTTYNLPLTTNHPDILHIYPDKSIGIMEIRKVQDFLSRMPLQSAVNTVIIHQAELLTLPAQNAFLKTLEEPPNNSLIYLVSDNPDNLLPTIFSRVQIITSDPAIHQLPENNSSVQLFKLVLSQSIGERVATLESQNFTKETALEFLTDLETSALTNRHFLPFLPQLWNTKKYLLANVNVRLCLGEFFFSLPRQN